MKKGNNPRLTLLLSLILSLSFLLASNPKSVAEEVQENSTELVGQFKSFSTFPRSASWQESAPYVKAIKIKSTADGKPQPALYYDSGTDRKKPLLVVLHSWSENYRQRISIPYAVWSKANDWVFIHPDYRGIFNNPDATGSELAVRDIVDAVEYARENARIDPSRVYLVGFSGGAMMALTMAGRYPELWTAVASWGPAFNLSDWYGYVERFPRRHYARHIIASCGGIPREGSAAFRECNKRSPSTYLRNARGKRVRIHISHGIHDDFTPPSHSLRAYNELARPQDRISEEEMKYIDSKGRLPTHLAGPFSDRLYEKAGSSLLFRKTSGNATISLFNGGHDVLYNAGLYWLSGQAGG